MANKKIKKKTNKKIKKKQKPQRSSKKQREQRALRGVKSKGYVSSYLDLSPNTPGKYGVDY